MKYVLWIIVIIVFLFLFDRAMQKDMENLCKTGIISGSCA